MGRLFWQEMKFRRNSIIGWGIGLALYVSSYIVLYPSMESQLAAFNLEGIAIYEALNVADMASFEGYVAGSVVNLLPIFLGIFAIMNGSGTLAGEEDDGRLELILTLPLPRWQLVLAKALALVLSAGLIVFMVALSLAGSFVSIESQLQSSLGASDLFWSCFWMLPLVWAVGMIALFFSAYLPDRRTAVLAAALVFIVSYVGNTMANMYDALDGVRWLFLFNYYEVTADIFRDGPDVGAMLILMALALLFLAMAIWAFQRRNITVGAWPWQRAVEA